MQSSNFPVLYSEQELQNLSRLICLFKVHCLQPCHNNGFISEQLFKNKLDEFLDHYNVDKTLRSQHLNRNLRFVFSEVCRKTSLSPSDNQDEIQIFRSLTGVTFVDKVPQQWRQMEIKDVYTGYMFKEGPSLDLPVEQVRDMIKSAREQIMKAKSRIVRSEEQLELFAKSYDR
jgi:hypothetical protein